MTIRLITAVAVALALVGPSAALAGSSPDDRALPRGTSFGQPVHPSALPDDRALPRSTTLTVAPQNTAVSPDDRAFARSIPVERTTLVRVSATGFDWTDAGVGAATGFGIALVLAGAGLILMRRGSGRPIAA